MMDRQQETICDDDHILFAVAQYTMSVRRTAQI